ncbi:MAG: 3'(2'),5'-bisphosphate nucleotidase CysQ, partial [Pseudomonadota bacterium]
MDHFHGNTRAWQKGPGQIVTDADLEIDRFLREALLDEAREEAWLSEETEDDRHRLQRQRVWVVDPIDGTRSFVEGKSEFTICVALLHASSPVFGFVLNPAKGEVFEARLGGGAVLNGNPIRTSSRDALTDATIVVSKSENHRRRFEEVLPSATITTIGSLAYKIVLVASGEFDGYLSWRRSHDWDIAAADLILSEAGGVLTGAKGEPIRYNKDTV